MINCSISTIGQCDPQEWERLHFTPIAITSRRRKEAVYWIKWMERRLKDAAEHCTVQNFIFTTHDQTTIEPSSFNSQLGSNYSSAEDSVHAKHYSQYLKQTNTLKFDNHPERHVWWEDAFKLLANKKKNTFTCWERIIVVSNTAWTILAQPTQSYPSEFNLT